MIDINWLLLFIQFILNFSFFEMLHDYNTRHWHESVSESDSASNYNPSVRILLIAPTI